MTLPASPPADPKSLRRAVEPQELLLVRCSLEGAGSVETWLKAVTWPVRQCFSLDHALELILQRPPSAVLVETLRTEHPQNDLLGWLEGVCSILPVILVTPDTDPVSRTQLRRLGVFALMTPQELGRETLAGRLDEALGWSAPAQSGQTPERMKLVVQKLQAERASRAASRLLAAIVHDLRQPMHALSLFAEELRRLCPDPTALSVVSHMNASLHSMSVLLDSAQVLARLDTDQLVPGPMAFPIDPMLARLRSTHQGAALAKGLRLVVAGSQAHVVSDPGLLERILNNLVANAVEYTVTGGVLVACRRRGERLLIQVWDTGVGIAPEEQAAVFREFYQVAGERHPSSGSGLGLSIVRRCADALGLKIGLRSEPGRGSCFSFELPCATSADPDADHLLLRQDELDQAPERPLDLTLMLIGADNAGRVLLTPLLERWGCRVLQVSTLRDSQVVASRLAGGLHALIGVLSPGTEALIWSAIRSLRSARNARLPAILITADTSLHATRLARRHGVTLIGRPLQPARLHGLLGWLGEAGGDDQPARS